MQTRHGTPPSKAAQNNTRNPPIDHPKQNSFRAKASELWRKLKGYELFRYTGGKKELTKKSKTRNSVTRRHKWEQETQTRHRDVRRKIRESNYE